LGGPSPRRSTERHNRLEQRGAVAFGKRGAAIAVMLRRAVGLYVLAGVRRDARAGPDGGIRMYSLSIIVTLIGALALAGCSDGAKESKGEKGEPGPPGPKGDPGVAGTT
jgi:hypothetical protein